MRLSYTAQDRLDLAETAKHLAQRMSEPREFDFIPLKRAARYLVGKPKAALRFRRQKHVDEITVFVDSDFAGDPVSRKSTTELVEESRRTPQFEADQRKLLVSLGVCFFSLCCKKVPALQESWSTQHHADPECSGCSSVRSCHSETRATSTQRRVASVWFRERGQDLCTKGKESWRTQIFDKRTRVEAAKSQSCLNVRWRHRHCPWHKTDVTQSASQNSKTVCPFRERGGPFCM